MHKNVIHDNKSPGSSNSSSSSSDEQYIGPISSTPHIVKDFAKFRQLINTPASKNSQQQSNILFHLTRGTKSSKELKSSFISPNDVKKGNTMNQLILPHHQPAAKRFSRAPRAQSTNYSSDSEMNGLLELAADFDSIQKSNSGSADNANNPPNAFTHPITHLAKAAEDHADDSSNDSKKKKKRKKSHKPHKKDKAKRSRKE
jgi:hypothetical protein